jgi:phosphatidylglycerol lysyltransferase
MTIAAVLISLTSLVVHLVHIQQGERYFLVNILDLIQVLIAWNLFTRKRLAWAIYTAAISLKIIFYLLDGEWIELVDVVDVVVKLNLAVNIYALAVLIIFHRSFNRKSVKLLSREALVPAGIMVFVLAFIYYLKRDASEMFDVILGGGYTRLDHAAGVTFWVCVVVALYLLLRPAFVSGWHSKSQRAYARGIIKQYGQNPSAYLILENDKILYLGKDVEGVIGYGVVGSVVVVLGDPVCADEDFAALLSEFKDFCLSGEYQCIFLGVTDKYLGIYEKFGYGSVKCGEEPRFEFEHYQLAGGKMAKMRMNINHAAKAGLETFEYKPNERRDIKLERRLKSVSDEWLGGKQIGQISFSLGTVGLDNPMDRRYFYAAAPDGKIVAFNVYTPFLGADGYMADITRRTHDCPGGATEKIMYDAFMTFKEEGYHWGSMGLAPLANVRGEGVKNPLTAKVLDFIYQKFNVFYGFKDLHRAKIKYSPTKWVPGYFAYSGKILTPQMAYALIRVQNTGKIRDFVSDFMHIIKTRKKRKRDAQAAG